MVNVERIAKAEIFVGLSEEELKEIALLCQLEEARKGTLLCANGSLADKLYILERGKVDIRFEGGFSFDISEPGQIIGWSTLINPHRFRADAVCVEDTRLISMNGAELLDLARKHKNIGFVMMNNLAGVVFDRLQSRTQYY